LTQPAGQFTIGLIISRNEIKFQDESICKLRDVLDQVDLFLLCGGKNSRIDRRNTMPRQTRLDAPGTVHHVIGRGIEKHRNVKGAAGAGRQPGLLLALPLDW
jgi:hypothetical protein